MPFVLNFLRPASSLLSFRAIMFVKIDISITRSDRAPLNTHKLEFFVFARRIFKKKQRLIACKNRRHRRQINFTVGIQIIIKYEAILIKLQFLNASTVMSSKLRSITTNP